MADAKALVVVVVAHWNGRILLNQLFRLYSIFMHPDKEKWGKGKLPRFRGLWCLTWRTVLILILLFFLKYRLL